MSDVCSHKYTAQYMIKFSKLSAFHFQGVAAISSADRGLKLQACHDREMQLSVVSLQLFYA